jgi:phage gp29-like protein
MPPANLNPASRNKPKPPLEEIASVRRRGSTPPTAFACAPGESSDRRVYPILRNESMRAFGQASDIHSVYQEMEDKDGHLFAALQTRKLGVLARGRRLSPPPPDAPLSEEARALCQRALDGIPDFERVLLGILDALAKGFAVLEILWTVADDGAVLPERVIPRWPGRFVLAEDGALRRIDPGDPIGGVPMPPRKFLTAVFQSTCGAVGGTGLCMRAYWYAWFKRNNLKAWALFNEKHGSPAVMAHFPAGADQSERDRLMEVIDSLQQDAGVILPEGVTLELLEAKRSGQVETYRDLADWCNDEISKIVLGQTLATGEGRRSGSMALGQVHASVRREYIASDARMLERVINDQLLRWVVDFNLGPDVPASRLTLDADREEGLLQEAELDKLLVGLGVPLGLDYFYEKYRRPRPAEIEKSRDVLRYDDQNLFQYHLRFGILTVNEARARLGLPPVKWGNAPVNDRELSARSDSSLGESGREDPREQEVETNDDGAEDL